jgi:hypothetical protein
MKSYGCSYKKKIEYMYIEELTQMGMIEVPMECMLLHTMPLRDYEILGYQNLLGVEKESHLKINFHFWIVLFREIQTVASMFQ